MLRRNGVTILCAVLATALLAQPVSAQKRVALVVGNSAYQNVPTLRNPARDAEAIGLLFQAASFDTVQVHRDLSVAEMRRIVRDFSEQTRDSDIAVIYYAGHGIEVGGNNYLLPIDASLRRDIDVEDETVSLDRLLQVIEPAKRLRLVILDACRDNPFARSMARTVARRSVGRGLARVEPVTSDTLIAFAAKAGMYATDGQGTNSPFTTSLIKNLVTPGLDVRLALGRVRDEVLAATNHQQEPFVYGSLGGASISLAAESIADRFSSADLAIKLVSILEKAAPPSAKDTATNYSKSGTHRALAIAPKARGPWWTSDWPSREVAEEKVLEKCLQFYDEPCAIIATDDSLRALRADGVWFTQDAPRVRYSGIFNPERIPAIRQPDLNRPEIAGYAALLGAKAAAFHATGIFTVGAGTGNQRAAEEQALKECNASPTRNRSGGPCYLYAVENRIVLPLRLTLPMTPSQLPLTPSQAGQNPPSSGAPQSVDAAKPDAAPRQSPADIFRAALSSVTEDLAPAMPDKRRLDQVGLYHADTNHKALAAHPPADSWRSSDWPNEAAAEQNTLEACQMRYGDPCILVAINDKVQDKSSSGYRRARPMPRVAYEGVFDPQQIPFLREATRQRQDVANYKKSSSPKAIAIHPWGRVFIATAAASQRTAELIVLADCNNDPSREGRDGPCWLYAVDDQVVLPRRLKEPLTAPPTTR